MRLITKFKAAILNNSFMKNTSILAAGTAVSHLFILLTTPILTRLYTPEDFGLFSMYLSILYSVSVIASLMYDQAVPLPEDDQDGWDALVLSLIIVVIISAIVLTASFTLPIGKWVNAPELDDYAWLLALSVFGIGWFQAFNSWSIRTEDFTGISKAKVNMNSGQMISQISLGFLNAGLLGLLAGEVLGRLSGFLTFIKFTFKRKPQIRLFHFDGLKKTLIRYKKFPLISSWSAFIHVSSYRLPVIFLAAYYGPAVAGWFLLAEKILMVPEALLGNAVKQVYMSQSAKLATKGEELNSLFFMTIKKMAIISGSIIGSIVLISPFVIPVVFGKEWQDAGAYLQILSILFFMRMVIGPLSANFYVLESQNYQIISELIRFFLVCISVVISYYYIESPIMALLIISVLSSLGYLISGLISWHIMRMRFSKEDYSYYEV